MAAVLVVISFPFALNPESIFFTNASAGLLACGSHAFSRLPRFLQWHLGVKLSAYSCGGSRGIDYQSHRIPFSSRSDTDDIGTIL